MAFVSCYRLGIDETMLKRLLGTRSARDIFYSSEILQESLLPLNLILPQESHKRLPVKFGNWKLRVHYEEEFYTVNLENFVLTKFIKKAIFRLERFRNNLYDIYNHDLESYIVENIDSSDNKVDTVHRYLNTIKLLNLKGIRSINFLRQILRTLMLGCPNSNLVIQFISLFEYQRYVDLLPPSILKYILHHARLVRYELWRPSFREIIENCILNKAMQNISILLECGMKFCVPSSLSLDTINRMGDVALGCKCNDLRNSVKENQMSAQANYLTLLVLHLIRTKSDRDLMCEITRSIPDPYLSCTELKSVLHRLGGALQKHVATLYMKEICESQQCPSPFHLDESAPCQVTPRSIVHLSRVAIRRFLAENHQMPNGIHQLGLPRGLVSYLQLKY